MQPAAIQLPALVTSRPPARQRAVVPAAALRGPAREPSARMAPPAMPALPRPGMQDGRVQDGRVHGGSGAAASPTMARAIAAYRAADTAGTGLWPGALGVDLRL